MEQHKRLLVNATSSILQTVINSAILFTLYKFLLITIGVEKLGIWSLVLAASSVTMISNFGLTGSIVKYVAKHLALGNRDRVSQIIQTALLSAGAIAGLALLAAYPLLKWILGRIVPFKALPLALVVLPYALIAFWLVIVTGVCQGGLDGCQRIDRRNLILLCAAVLNLVLCVLLAPKYQLVGLGCAKIIGNFLALVISWLALRRLLPELPAFPRRWSAEIFREIAGYGVNFQVISIIAMFYDPITKGLLTKFGGLSIVGYYEMASRMITQIRSLIVSANQAVVPVIADLKEKTPEKIRGFYLTSYQLLVFLALPLFVMVIVSTPMISRLWIGHIENDFVTASILLAVGWFLNMLNAPAYFAYLGTGELKWNIIGQLTIALVNIALGFVLGSVYGGPGVITAWAVALAIGSSVVYLSYHRKNDIPLSALLPRESLVIAVTGVAVAVSFYLVLWIEPSIARKIIGQMILILMCATVLAFPLWRHPMRKRIVALVRGHLLGGGHVFGRPSC